MKMNRSKNESRGIIYKRRPRKEGKEKAKKERSQKI
jgi:hypothetical protein